MRMNKQGEEGAGKKREKGCGVEGRVRFNYSCLFMIKPH